MGKKPDDTSGRPKLTDQQKHEVDRLLDKSQEAFILAIEIFNRPTIRYRVEGCAFFLCNAWELLLKAFLIRRDGYETIFYRHQPGRTISLDDSLGRVMTNENDPVRRNVEAIERLRNEGTHFIVEEYDQTYGPLFQANIADYDKRLEKYTGISISDRLPDNFAALTFKRTSVDTREITAKYPLEVAEHLLKETKIISTSEKSEDNIEYSAYYKTDFRLTKSTGIPIHYSDETGPNVNIIKRLIEPEKKYPYTTKKCVAEINKQLKKKHCKGVVYKDSVKTFNLWHFNLFARYYRMKDEEAYCYDFVMHGGKKDNHYYLYSRAAIDMIVGLVLKDPENIIGNLKTKIDEIDRESLEDKKK